MGAAPSLAFAPSLASMLRVRHVTAARARRERGVRGVIAAWERRERGVSTAWGASLQCGRGVTTSWNRRSVLVDTLGFVLVGVLFWSLSWWCHCQQCQGTTLLVCKLA